MIRQSSILGGYLMDLYLLSGALLGGGPPKLLYFPDYSKVKATIDCLYITSEKF